MKHFGQILKKHIETNGLAKKDVAQSVGITHNYLSTIFTKASIDAELLERLCLAVGLSPSVVFDNVPGMQKNCSDINATALMGLAQVSIGTNETLYQNLLAEKERTINILLDQIATLKGTVSGQQ